MSNKWYTQIFDNEILLLFFSLKYWDNVKGIVSFSQNIETYTYPNEFIFYVIEKTTQDCERKGFWLWWYM